MRFLFNLIRNACQSIHKRRLDCLQAATEALFEGKKLSLVALGRRLKSEAKTKHCIKRMDRLLGNIKINSERILIYKFIANILIGTKKNPVILIDWSGLTKCGKYLMIRAAVPLGGRAITIYEEVHPEKDYDNRRVNTKFLHTVKEVLPAHCSPIIVTDSGFKNPWFKAVEDLGWHWIGRVRSKTQFRQEGSRDWIPVNELHKKATRKARFIGTVHLAKSNPLLCNFFLYKEKRKNRRHVNLRGHRVRCSVSLKHARREREPWLLASSLPKQNGLAKKIVKIYKTRMQIEESFRDIKNPRFGFSLSETRSRGINRFNVLLLIGALGSLGAHMLGKIAKNMSKHYSFQSNTVRNKNVLSLFFLGCEFYRNNHHFDENIYLNALQNLYGPVTS
jgi:hypothetical protein